MSYQIVEGNRTAPEGERPWPGGAGSVDARGSQATGVAGDFAGPIFGNCNLRQASALPEFNSDAIHEVSVNGRTGWQS